MLANHRFEVGLEKRTLRRCKSIKLAEEISASEMRGEENTMQQSV